jgi:hypothetical protein
MNGRRDTELVEARADLILADELSVKAYGRHFETQMRHGRIRRLLYASCLHLARAGPGLPGFDAGATW